MSMPLFKTVKDVCSVFYTFFEEDDFQEIRLALTRIMKYWRDHQIVPLYGKIKYADERASLAMDVVHQIKQYSPHCLMVPLVYESVQPSVAGTLSVIGIRENNVNIRASGDEGSCAYISYEHRGIRYLNGYVPFTQAESAYEKQDEILKKCGFNASMLVRYWIYLTDIRRDYVAFNQIRNQYFQKQGIRYSKESQGLSASTCIQGKTWGDKNVLQFYALEREHPAISVRRIHNPLQNEADGDSYLYKPAFARAVVIERVDQHELQLSGTASIGPLGETLHPDDAYQQMETTMVAIDKILELSKMSWKNLMEGNCFFKDGSTFENFLILCKKRGVDFTGISMLRADVCRDDLLFEMDGIFVK